MIACSIFLGIYRHLYVENLAALCIRAIFDFSKKMGRRRRSSASNPLENRQSGGGQSTGIDILSVRGSVQGRF